MLNFENHIISITTDSSFKTPEEYNDDTFDILGPYKKENGDYGLLSDNNNNNIHDNSNATKPVQNNHSFNSLYGILFTDEEENTSISSELKSSTSSTTTPNPASKTSVPTIKNHSNNLTNNTIPLKLITILNNSKKENPGKIEIPQRKNNKIIDPTDEPLLEDTNIPLATTEMSVSSKPESQSNENLTTLRDVFLSSHITEELLHKSPLFLSRPINKLSPSFINSNSNFPNLNSLESKHTFQANPIRSELDLIIPELNKNKQPNHLSHTNNFGAQNYHVIDTNTESFVVNPVDVDKLKQHQSNGETEIFTPPHKDPAGLLKLAGCNIYGRMYRVGRIIAELSSNCLECRCTEVGVSCTPLNC